MVCWCRAASVLLAALHVDKNGLCGLYMSWPDIKTRFLTLTYADEHLPPNGSLVVADLQKFIKRLRKHYAKRNNGIKLRYYACGEYGDRYGRPHYHAIICGLSLRQEDKDLVKLCWPFGLCHLARLHLILLVMCVSILIKSLLVI